MTSPYRVRFADRKPTEADLPILVGKRDAVYSTFSTSAVDAADLAPEVGFEWWQPITLGEFEEPPLPAVGSWLDYHGRAFKVTASTAPRGSEPAVLVRELGVGEARPMFYPDPHLTPIPDLASWVAAKVAEKGFVYPSPLMAGRMLAALGIEMASGNPMRTTNP